MIRERKVHSPAHRTRPCPECGEPADYEPESFEEEEVWGVTYRWVNPGCWGCPECGWSEVDND